MKTLVKFKEICFAAATFGVVGNWRFGYLVAMLGTIPFLYFLRSLYWFNQQLFVYFLIALFAAIVVVLQSALQYPTDKDPSCIVLDRALGFMIVFLGIPLNLKFLIVGFILFHAANFFQPIVWYQVVHKNLERLPGFLGVVASDVLAGVSVNFFFRFILWMSQ
ncbi:phosphatidylglycerophosphatase A [Candidatus Babeliales bacterium]|nr:phosphatidylglycerophosphatase A [Candidatus Babeliales bacterium]